MFITTINDSTWYLKYRSVDTGTRSSDIRQKNNIGLGTSKLDANVLESIGSKQFDVNMAVREIHPFNNKYARLIPSKLDAYVLYFTVIQSHFCVDIFPLQTNASYVSIGSLVLMLHSISRKVRDTKIVRIVPNINILKYLTTPPHVYCNIFV